MEPRQEPTPETRARSNGSGSGLGRLWPCCDATVLLSWLAPLSVPAARPRSGIDKGDAKG
jgi:hypothetical protein